MWYNSTVLMTQVLQIPRFLIFLCFDLNLCCGWNTTFKTNFGWYKTNYLKLVSRSRSYRGEKWNSWMSAFNIWSFQLLQKHVKKNWASFSVGHWFFSLVRMSKRALFCIKCILPNYLLVLPICNFLLFLLFSEYKPACFIFHIHFIEEMVVF